MTEGLKKRQSGMPHVALISEHNPLSYEVVKLFRESSCLVKVLSEDIHSWTRGGLKRGEVGVVNDDLVKQLSLATEYDYVLLFSGFSEERISENKARKIDTALKLGEEGGSKVLIVLPLTLHKEAVKVVKTWVNKVIERRRVFAGVLLIGDVWTGRGFLPKNSSLKKVLQHLLEGGVLPPERKITLYALDLEKAAKVVVRELFSLSPYGNKTAVVGRPLSISKLLRVANRYKLPRTKSPTIERKEKSLVWGFESLEFNEKIFVESTPDTILDSAFQYYENLKGTKTPAFPSKKGRGGRPPWLRFDISTSSPTTNGRRIRLAAGEIKPRRAERRISEAKTKPKDGVKSAFRVRHIFNKLNKLKERQKRKYVVTLFGLILFALFIPAFSVIFGLMLVTLAKQSYIIGQTKTARGFLTLSLPSSYLGREVSSYLSSLPLAGESYKGLKSASQTLVYAADTGLTFLSSVEILNQLAENMFSDRPYDAKDLSSKLYLNVDEVGKKLGFFHGELASSPKFLKTYINKFIIKTEIKKLRENVSYVEKIAAELPQMLGLEEEITYLFIVQNNFILRPSGGRIDYFAVLSFDKGRLVKKEFFETNVLEEELKGKVLPPEPLLIHLGEENWSLKDAGWDPDFSVSANKVEWFVEKTLDRSVDGVIAVDLKFLGQILKHTGSARNDASGATIDEQSFYKSMVDEEENSYLKVFLQNVFLKGFNLGSSKRNRIFTEIVNGLDDKNIQLFLHNNKVQRALSDLGWDGGVKILSCGENCYSDFLSLIESNFADKPAINVKREAQIEVKIEEKVIKRKLTVFIDNSAEEGDTVFPYRTYIRLITTGDVGFAPVELIDEDGRRMVEPAIYGFRGFKEAGVLLEIPKNEVAALIFNWESGVDISLAEKGSYLLSWQKQSGVEDYPITVGLDTPDNLDVSFNPKFSLTEGGKYLYNSTSTRDFISRMFW